MSRRYVLDAGFLALYFAGRADIRRYVEEAYRGEARAYVCEINLAEFLYNYARVFGWEAAAAKNSLIRNSPVIPVGVDEDLTLSAARLKLRYYGKLSLADCYLAALAGRLNATVLTSDPALRDVGEVDVEYFEV